LPAGKDLASSLNAALAGDRSAQAEFLRRISGIVWTSCTILVGDGAEARAAFEDVAATLSADGFARLRGYSGRGRVETYVSVVVRDILAVRVLRLLQDDKARGWKSFEQFFSADLQRLVRRRLSGPSYEDLRQDAYQEVCAAFVADGYRRLRSYSGNGSFTGFVLRTADRLLIDFLRMVAPRRRLPAAVARLGSLEQAVFKLMAWQGVGADPERLEVALTRCFSVMPTRAQVQEAVAAVRSFAQDARANGRWHGAAVSLSAMTDDAADALIGRTSASPEDISIDNDDSRLLDAALAALREAASQLCDDERIYLEVALSRTETLPAREIASLMQRPVDDIYKLKQRIMKRLRDAMANDLAVKNWRASVIKNGKEYPDRAS
jgi:RNA polymerase primary sigma factor